VSDIRSGVPSNRDLIQRFAAHLAHSLNGPDVHEIKPFMLYRSLVQVLAARSKGYEQGLVGQYLYGPQTTPEQAADTFFKQVLERPLWLARDGHTHKAHDLFLAVCQRGAASGWQTAKLERVLKVVAQTGGEPEPEGFQGVADRLQRLPQSVSDGNPAKSTRAKVGPLYLKVGATLEIAEEMSVWASICSAPSRVKPLQPGVEFNQFCSHVIKAVETANASYGTLVSLGLSPTDWRDLSINTAKKVSAFLSDARKASEVHKIECWRAVWTSRQVPGFDTADELWASELGHALRNRSLTLHAGDDVETVADGRSFETVILENDSFKPMLEACQKAGGISQPEVDLMLALSIGSTVDEVAMGLVGRKLGDKLSKKNRQSYLADLQQRLRNFALEMMDV
jgi:hypothetical protein